MLIGISAAKQQIIVVQYLCAVHGFKSLTVEALEAAAVLPERAVVVLSNEADAELVRWGGGLVVHVYYMHLPTGREQGMLTMGTTCNPLPPLGSYNQPEDICILAEDSSEACNLISDVVNYEIADEDESFYEYLERVGRLEAHGLDGWREEMAEFEALEAVAA